MDLSSELISQFAKITNDNKKEKTESTVYGMTVVLDGRAYVKLDGSDRLTPVETTTAVAEDERVIVTIKDHTATITGNVTNHLQMHKDIDDLNDKIDEFDTVIADKVKAETAELESAIINKLDGKYATFEGLDAKYASVDKLEAAEAEIDDLQADNVEINNKLTARDAEIDQLKANSLTVEVADLKYATIGNLEATNVKVNNLESTYGDFVDVTTDKIEAIEADIKNLDVESLDAKYASIDFSNIGEAAIEKLFTDSGIIEDLTMSDGKVTGKLVGVTIIGDIIEGNTVKADKLVIQGEDGLYYKLNVNSLGEATASSDPKYQNGLDGSVIVAKSITAEQIRAEDLVAFGATIGGFHINDHALYSGVKASIDNTTEGIFLGDDGQVNIGNSNNYLKFYKDQNGNYKLDISASSIKFSSGTDIETETSSLKTRMSTVEQTASGLSSRVTSVENIQVGGRNLVLGTSVPFERPITADLVSYSGGKTYALSPTILNDSKAFWLSFDKDEYLTLSFDIEFPRLKRNSALSLNRVGVYWQVTSTHTNGTTKTWYGTHSNQTGKTNKHSIPSITNSLVGYGDTESGVIGHYSVYVNVRTALSYLYDDPDNYTVVTKSNINVEQYGYTTGGYIKNVKLERGNRPTDWTPAPEDTDTAIDNIQVGGTNLLRHDSSSWAQGTWNNAGTLNSTTTRIACLTQIPIKANTPYIISRFNNDYVMAIVKYGPNGRWYDSGWISTYPYVIEPESSDYMLAVHVRHTNNTQIMTPDLMKDTVRFKIEQGNKPTDWTPAPEDVDADIDAVQERLVQAESNITQLADSLEFSVTDGSGESLMTHTSTGWTFSMGAFEDALNNLLAHIKIGTYDDKPCLELTVDGSKQRLMLTNTNIQFMESDTIAASITGDTMNIDNASIDNKFSINGYEWSLDSDDTLNLVFK